MKRFIGVILLSLVFSLISMGPARGNEEAQPMDNDPIALSVAKALRIANSKARELGFEPEEFYISITNKLGKFGDRFYGITEEKYRVWKVYYAPKRAPGVIKTGGDLTIYINRETWEILKVWEGE